MSNKTLLVIDSTTGTILNLENCYVVNPSDLSEDQLETLDNGPDSDIGDIAESQGSSLRTMLSDTGYGDNKYRWTISYSPASVQEELEELLSNGYFEEEDVELDAIRWYLFTATREQREFVSNTCLAYDFIWQDFRTHLLHVLVEVSTEQSTDDFIDGLLNNQND